MKQQPKANKPTLAVQKELAKLDSTMNKGISRVYHQQNYNKECIMLAKEHKDEVLAYIFQGADSELIESKNAKYKGKIMQDIIAPDGTYIYTAAELIENGTPKGKYYEQEV